MNEPIEIFLGFDPGGATKTAFGWCVCTQDASGHFELLDSGAGHYAGEVFDLVSRVMNTLPSNARVRAAGIDAPLFWDRQGRIHRNVDQIIHASGGRRPTSINGLYGSVVAQGVLLAALLRQHFINLAITEAFPGALRDLLKARSADKSLPAELERYKAKLKRSKNPKENHEWDALAAAYAAWCMHRQAEGWRDLFPEEPNPVLPLGTPVSYWMPIP